MQKEELGIDENRNPEPRLLGVKKEKCRPEGLEGQLHNLTNRIPSGTWESNGHSTEAAEGGAPLSPSNTLNIRNLQLSEREAGPPAPHRYPHRYHPHPRPFHAAHRRSYRPGAKEWGPSTNGHSTGDSRGGWASRRRPFPEPPRSPERTSPSSFRTGQASGRPAALEDAGKATEPWALFRPPPAFPVDSSRARTVPKISYASKLKENLECQPACVPASALRTTGSLPKCTPPPPAEPHLGAIFQNQWGLSFINEPGAGQAGGNVLPLDQEETPPMAAPGLQGPGDPAEGPVPTAGESRDCWQQMNHKDWEEARDYHTEAWDHIWKLHRQAPSRVMVYAEPLDGKG
uniref:Nuclear fragile X mental retardation-interacting protein 2-like n=1 Tax=Pelusios castaneus TaxID=367368 RepID=A0A8C8S6E5_9SAUR